jgi:pimeloyl-ACP methyl ester carboxylesterase
VQERLGEIECPTLVLVGELDVPDMRAVAAHVAESIPGGELVTVPGAAHLPSLEQPEFVNARLLEFLG